MSESALPEPTPYDKFNDLLRKVVAVPKPEIDARETKFKEEQAKKPKRKKK